MNGEYPEFLVLNAELVENDTFEKFSTANFLTLCTCAAAQRIVWSGVYTRHDGKSGKRPKTATADCFQDMFSHMIQISLCLGTIMFGGYSTRADFKHDFFVVLTVKKLYPLCAF